MTERPTPAAPSAAPTPGDGPELAFGQPAGEAADELRDLEARLARAQEAGTEAGSDRTELHPYQMPKPRRGKRALAFLVIAGVIAGIGLGATLVVRAVLSDSDDSVYDATVAVHNQTLDDTAEAAAAYAVAQAAFRDHSELLDTTYIADLGIAASAPTELVSEQRAQAVIEFTERLAGRSFAAAPLPGLPIDPTVKPLPTSATTEVTAEVLERAQEATAAAERTLATVRASQRMAEGRLAAIDAIVFEGADAVVGPVRDALKVAGALPVPPQEHSSIDVYVTVDTLAWRLEDYTESDTPTFDEATGLVSEYAALVTAYTGYLADEKRG